MTGALCAAAIRHERQTMSMTDREEIKQYLEGFKRLRIRDRTIKAIDVNPSHHSQPPLHIEVGKTCAHLEPDAPPQLVVAIFEAAVFLVCTPERGAGIGLPYFFAREDVTRVKLFE